MGVREDQHTLNVIRMKKPSFPFLEKYEGYEWLSFKTFQDVIW